MKFVHVAICAALLSFLLGLIWSTQTRHINSVERVAPVNTSYTMNASLTDEPKREVNWDDPNLGQPVVVHDHDLKPCSQVNTMPCDTSPPNPVKEKLDAVESRPGLFKKGEKVTCIYPAIYWWTDGNEFVKNVAMKCTVVQASEPWDDLEKDYQHVQVDCSKDIDFQSSSQPGVGMVKGHKLMFKVRWFSSTDCYKFQQQ